MKSLYQIKQVKQLYSYHAYYHTVLYKIVFCKMKMFMVISVLEQLQ